MKITYSFLLLFFISATGWAQSLDSIVRQAEASFKLSGATTALSIGIIKNGQSYFYHFGDVRKGMSEMPDNQSIYEIGSVTKTFTSLLLAQAVLEHKVKLRDDIRKYLRGSYSNLEYKGKPIRLLHLANLTSGLPNNLPEKIPALKTAGADSQLFEIRQFHDSYTKARFLKDLHAVKLHQEPGLSPTHSNTAAQLLGYLLENIYGATYQELLAKYVTGPFKMSSTYVSVPASKKAFCVPGYNDNGILMPDIPKDAASAGILKSSLPDMLTYLKNQMSELDKRIILSHKPTWGEIGNMAIGLNWNIKTNFDDRRKLWVSGGTFGQSCYLCMYPERKFGVVILSNESDGGAEDRLTHLAQTIYNELYFTVAQRSSEGFGFSASINNLLDSLNKHGFDNAIRAADNLKSQNRSFKLYEEEVNNWGYYYFFKNQKAKALEIFKLNVSLYPQSANTYDSLAETYEALGNKVEAIENYKLELKLNPDNKEIAEHVKKIEKE